MRTLYEQSACAWKSPICLLAAWYSVAHLLNPKLHPEDQNKRRPACSFSKWALAVTSEKDGPSRAKMGPSKKHKKQHAQFWGSISAFPPAENSTGESKQRLENKQPQAISQTEEAEKNPPDTCSPTTVQLTGPYANRPPGISQKQGTPFCMVKGNRKENPATKRILRQHPLRTSDGAKKRYHVTI